MTGERTSLTPEEEAIKRARRKERGQSMVEFALLLPLFLIVIFLAIDFGVGLGRWVVLTNATREGARFGVTGVSPNEVATRTAATTTGLVTAGDVIVNYIDISGNGTIGDKGDSIVVEANYDYELITPLKAFLSLGFDSLTFSSCTNMRMELPASGVADDGVTRC